MMSLHAVVAFVLVIAQEKNEAEELFKKMEEKLAKAKTVQVKGSGSSEMSEGEMKAATVLLWETGNKARLDTELTIPGMGDIKGLYVSDGKHAAARGPESKDGKTPEKLTSDLVQSWARGGGFFVIMWIEAATFKDENHPKRAQVPKPVGFKMGPKEKVGDREAQKIEYALTNIEAEDVSMALWIDPETFLPVKREMRGFHGKEKLTYFETYSDLKLDEKIDAAKFELPKDTK
ncbi:MAG TPA: hypothetical protein VFS19_06630 [Planctomycetota bacterium]|nr:hypothetical protein [Planctomycetota bacterium]